MSTRPAAATAHNGDQQQGAAGMLVVPASNVVAIDDEEIDQEMQQQQQQPQQQDVQQLLPQQQHDRNETLLGSIQYIEPDFIQRIRIPVKTDDDIVTTTTGNAAPPPHHHPSPEDPSSSSSSSSSSPRDDAAVDELKMQATDSTDKTDSTTSPNRTMETEDDDDDDDDHPTTHSTLIPDTVNYKELGENMSYFAAGRSPNTSGTTRTTAVNTSGSSRGNNRRSSGDYQYEVPVPVAVAIHDDTVNNNNNNAIIRNQQHLLNDMDPPLVLLQEQPQQDEEFGNAAASSDEFSAKKQKQQQQQQILLLAQERRKCAMIYGAIVLVLVLATATAVGLVVSSTNSSNNRRSVPGAAVSTTTPTAAPSMSLSPTMTATPTISYMPTNAPTSIPTYPGRPCATVRCGTSWVDAAQKCGAQCLAGSCPQGESCFANVDTPLECCATTETSWRPDDIILNKEEDGNDNGNRSSSSSGGINQTEIVFTPTCSAIRCGKTWAEANGKCGVSCQVQDASCPSGESCYSMLSTTTTNLTNVGNNNYNNNNNSSSSSTTCINSSRCGTSWRDANQKCGVPCFIPSCPTGELCFGDLSTSLLECCHPNEESQSALPSENNNKKLCKSTRCGLTWANANNVCGQNCETDAECTEVANTKCFADLQVAPDLDCCAPIVSCTSSRCGFTYALANAQCGADCTTDADCAIGQVCFADLETISLDCCDVEVPVLGSSAVNSTNSTAEEAAQVQDDEETNIDNTTTTQPALCTTTRCGLSWVTANSNCGTNCVDDADCTQEGEGCFADLTIDLACSCASVVIPIEGELVDGSSAASNTTDTPTAAANITDTPRAATNITNTTTSAAVVVPEDELVPPGCTTVRCGLSWGVANSNCGTNCVDNGNCKQAGETCFADLTVDLACCAV